MDTDKYLIEVADTAAALAVIGQTLSETDPDFCKRLERNCERLYRVLGEEGSKYFSENKAATTLRLAGEYLRKVEIAKLDGAWETY